MVKASQIPTLGELRAFEAVARLKSISSAATELNCSQPCITNRLKALETRWAVNLFKRSTRSLEWTDRTQKIYSRVAQLLSELQSITREATDPGSSPLSVSVSPSFASMWLVSRLSSLQTRHPEIDVNLVATNRAVDLVREEIDIAIRLLPHDAPLGDGFYGFPLAQEKLLVVCSPEYQSRWKEGISLKNIAQTKLLCEEGTDHWARFFHTFGSHGHEKASGSTFNNADLVIRSAMEGQGIAIIRELLVADVLRQKLMVQCLPQTISSAYAYHFVCRKNANTQPKVADFMQWLVAEIQSCMESSRTP
ncbi:LysR substrate-binding domain-containing protein [Pseudomonas sp. NPDC086278]|uniref:LysR substrate-binding domain-containing protein n=1 Tax=Pseudomonas sp. NPDC086278 TaxID=3390646 RepID=UPI003D021DE0